MAVLLAPNNELVLPATTPEMADRKEEVIANVVTPSAPTPDQATMSSSEGGAAARGADEAREPEPAGAQAPPGVAKDYAVSVMRVLARNKPSPQGALGTTRVRFTVGGDGNVRELEVLRSSGHAKLDAAAMAAVKRIQFPAPPMTLSRLQTTYDLPFHFR